MSIRPANRLEKECKIMRKIGLLVAVFCLSTMLFADTAKSKSATLQFSMTAENYKFGFANGLEEAKAGTEETNFTIDSVDKTMYFFWKVMVPNKMKITLSSNGPLKNTSTPADYQKIDYQIEVASSSEPGWWPTGAALTDNKVIKSSDTAKVVSANLKGDVNYYYTQGICVLSFKMIDSSGKDITSIDSLKTTKEGGTYTSTITLTISSV